RYFASRSPYKPKEVPMEIRESYEIGARLARQACNSCHMNPFYGGRPANPLVPMLTGQSKQYLMTQLLYFRNRERLSPIMHEMTRELSPEDIFNLAVYYAYEASR